MDNRPSKATTDALKALERLKQGIRKLNQSDSRKDRTAEKLIDEGVAEIRERVLELDRLTASARQDRSEPKRNTESMADKVLKTWGLHEAINVAKDKLGSAWEMLKDLIDYLN